MELFVVSDKEFRKPPKCISLSCMLACKAAPGSKLFSSNLISVVELDYCSIRDKRKWKNWRISNRTTPTSSLLSSYFGHNTFVTYNKSIYTKMTEQPEDEEVEIVKVVNPPGSKPDHKANALKHGTKHETHARQHFMEWFRKNNYQNHKITTISTGEMSVLNEITYDECKAHLISTPDLVLEVQDEPVIVEFKCPYFAILKKKDQTVPQVALSFATENPFGTESSFIQAATYALVHDAYYFYTAHYFTEGYDEESADNTMVIYKYRNSTELMDTIFGAISATETNLREFDPTKNPKFRSNTLRKRNISQLMKEHALMRAVYFTVSDTVCDIDVEGF